MNVQKHACSPEIRRVVILSQHAHMCSQVCYSYFYSKRIRKECRQIIYLRNESFLSVGKLRSIKAYVKYIFNR